MPSESGVPAIPRLDGMDDIKAWIYSHEAEIVQRWLHQYRLNDRLTDKVETHEKRLQVIERRVAVWAAAASVAGALVGTLLPQLVRFLSAGP